MIWRAARAYQITMTFICICSACQDLARVHIFCWQCSKTDPMSQYGYVYFPCSSQNFWGQSSKVPQTRSKQWKLRHWEQSVHASSKGLEFDFTFTFNICHLYLVVQDALRTTSRCSRVLLRIQILTRNLHWEGTKCNQFPADYDLTHSPKQVEVKCLAQGHLH